MRSSSACGSNRKSRSVSGLRSDEHNHGDKGDSPLRTVAVLAASPQMTTAMVEAEAGISRDTGERLLVRLAGMGLVRETTGATRCRLWTAAL